MTAQGAGASEPTLKYLNEINNHAPCPPLKCSPARGRAYRWVFNPITSDHFLPIARHPKRKGKCCSDWALSMFMTEDQAKTAHVDGRVQFPNFWKLGDHVAEGNLHPGCGVMDEPDNTGHFDLHEFEGADLPSLFTVKCPL